MRAEYGNQGIVERGWERGLGYTNVQYMVVFEQLTCV